jgi:hypothetical protein
MRCEIGYGGVGGLDPVIAVCAEAGRVVDPHFDEVFVVGVVTTVPATSRILE